MLIYIALEPEYILMMWKVHRRVYAFIAAVFITTTEGQSEQLYVFHNQDLIPF